MIRENHGKFELSLGLRFEIVDMANKTVEETQLKVFPFNYSIAVCEKPMRYGVFCVCTQLFVIVLECIAGLTTAAMAEALKMQKMKMMMNLHKTHDDSEFDSDELNTNTGTGLVLTRFVC